MFSYIFTKQNEHSPTFEIATIPFRLHSSGDFITVEYLGKSYRPHFYHINLIVSDTLFDFNFSYAIYNNCFSVPISRYETNLSVEVEIVEIENRAEPFVGFENFGATCYINSLLQTIYFMTGMKETLYKSNGYTSYLLQRLFYSMDLVNSKKITNKNEDSITNKNEEPITNKIEDPMAVLKDRLYNFIKNLDFVRHISEHQDVHEFSKFLFEALENDNKIITKNIFEGQVVSIVECEHGCISKTKQPFQDLQMIIKETFSTTSNFSIYESLKEFCRAGEIEDFKCEKHGKVKATKKVLFYELPPALFVLLNRFSMDWSIDKYVKINEEYHFPEELDLSEFMDSEHKKKQECLTDCNSDCNHGTKTRKLTEENKYKLFSVIVHSGTSTEGHFFCYLNINGKYYKFNDETVSECSKYEAVDWNFGGKYPNRGEKEKHFSAYYLVYLKMENEAETNFDALAMIPSEKHHSIIKSLEPFQIKYFEPSDILGYNGPGRFNLKSDDYQKTPFKTAMCYETDNISKIFHRKSVAYDSNFEIVKNKQLTAGTYYVSSSKKQGLLVFVKLFLEKPWCTFPSCLHSLGEKRVNNLKDFEKYANTKEFDLYLENYNFDCEPSENNVEENVKLVTDFSQIKIGDSLVLTPKNSNFIEFMRRFYSYHITNVIIENLNVPMFINRNISSDELKQEISSYFHTNEIKMVKRENNGLKCVLEPNSHLYYVGILSASNDLNLIDHVHSFVLKATTTVKDLLKNFRLSNFPCMAVLQNDPELCIVESHKKSSNVKILNESDLLDPRMEYLVIQRRIKRPIKISFYKGMYELLNYPFLLENPNTIRELRMKYFFSNRIVKFNGTSYVDCLNDDTIDLQEHEILLIEKE